MEFPRVKPRHDHDHQQGVYADLDDLIRLQFKAQGFTFLPRQPVHSILAGRHASRLRGRGLNFEEIRRYLPGDDIRNMDWKVTARMQNPHVRVYTEEKDRPTLLITDQRSSMFFGSQRAMKSVVAAEATALAAWRVLASGDRIGAVVFNDEKTLEIAPHRSQACAMRILKTVVTLNRQLNIDSPVQDSASMLNEALRQARRVAKHDYLVCLISDGCGADAETVRLVTAISQHNDVLFLFIYDPLEARLPDAGRLVMSHGELQLEVDTSSSRVRRKFSDDFQNRLDRIREISRLRSIPVLPITTTDGVAEQVRSLLGHVPR